MDFKIFSWFSAKIIYKFLCVCKQSLQLLFEYFFVTKQFINLQSIDDSCFFIQSNLTQSHKAKVEIIPLDNSSTCGVPHKSLEFLSNTGRIIGSSNGLICCRDITSDGAKGLFVCNPATQTWRSIPLADCLQDTECEFHVLFECNYGSISNFPNDYILMMMLVDLDDWDSNMLVVSMYSPQEGLWKMRGKIFSGARNIQLENPVYNNGTIYYMSDSSSYLTSESPFYWPYVLAFDVENYKSRFLAIPKDARVDLHNVSCKISIFKWRNNCFSSICLVKFVKGVFDVWWLVDEKLSKWKQNLNIQVGAMGLSELDPKVAGFAVLNGCSLIIVTKVKVYRYDLSDERKDKAEEISSHGCGRNILIHPYSSSLRPCGVDELPLPK